MTFNKCVATVPRTFAFVTAMPRHPTPIRFQRLLLTGAAGGLGQELRTRLKAYCTTLRLSDIANLGGEGGCQWSFLVLSLWGAGAEAVHCISLYDN